MSALLVARILTFTVALFMLVQSVRRHFRECKTSTTARIKVFTGITLAAMVSLLIHPFGPYSYVYLGGLSVVAVLLTYSVIIQLRMWRTPRQ